MLCIHHNDDDGLCAAAIVRREFINPFEPISHEDFIEYNYNGEIPLPKEIKDGQTVWFVDISLSEYVINAMKTLLSHNCKIIHIDHHESTFKFCENMDEETARVLDQITHFYKNGFAGCLLTWVYSFFSDEEKANPESVEWDTTENVEFALIHNADTRIPTGVSYIARYDVFNLKDPDVVNFHEGFTTVKHKDKHPMSSVWDDIIYQAIPQYAMHLVSLGPPRLNKLEDVYEKICAYTGVAIDLGKIFTCYEGVKAFVVNSPIGNSNLFGKKIDQYQVCIRWSKDSSGKYNYSLYSSNTREDALDCSELAAIMDVHGGGHKHAAGCITNKQYF